VIALLNEVTLDVVLDNAFMSYINVSTIEYPDGEEMALLTEVGSNFLIWKYASDAEKPDGTVSETPREFASNDNDPPVLMVMLAPLCEDIDEDPEHPVVKKVLSLSAVSFPAASLDLTL
jgi:hypothetical protein